MIWGYSMTMTSLILTWGDISAIKIGYSVESVDRGNWPNNDSTSNNNRILIFADMDHPKVEQHLWWRYLI